MYKYAYIWSNWEDNASPWVGDKLYPSRFDAVKALLIDYFDIAEPDNLEEWKEAIKESSELGDDHRLLKYGVLSTDFILILHDELFLYGSRWSKIAEFYDEL